VDGCLELDARRPECSRGRGEFFGGQSDGANITATLPSNITLGLLQFGGITNITTLANNNNYTLGGATVTFDNAGLGAQINTLGNPLFSGTASIDSNIALNDTLTINNNGTAPLTLANAGSLLNLGGNNLTVQGTGMTQIDKTILDSGGSPGVVQVNGGNLTLTAANTYSGNTSLAAGTLTLGNSLALQNSTLSANTGGGTLSFGSLTSATLGGLSGNQNLALVNATSGALALTVGSNNASTTYSGNLTNAGALTKTGTGTLTLTGTDNYSGTTTINGGTLIFTGNTSQLGGNLVNNATVTFNQGADSSFIHVISGTGP